MNFYPDFILRTVNEITAEWLDRLSIKGLLIDLDNTLAAYHAKEPNSDISEWIKRIKSAGYPIIVLSNAGSRRVSAFCAALDLPFVARARKPKPFAVLDACKRIGVNPENAVMIGDQIFTDVLSANRAGVRSAIVEPLTRNILFDFRRNVIEKRFIVERGSK
ncbi:MAG: YqeG family HAD IIIA-type phosphatase [Oscillospiraceae bacterium]|nr:YqeG family HAD IIIA-type phosphatase [Oscillospiraceae bacterium]